MEKFVLPALPYGYDGLEPHMSEEQLRLHHQKHHQAYVNGANALLDKLSDARKNKTDFDVKAVLKELAFNRGGHVLHSLFWKNLSPKGGGSPGGNLGKAIKEAFGSFEQFKKEFSQAAVSVEGSGWAALAFCRKSKHLFVMQVEKHNLNVYPGFSILMVLDAWEHAYYLDYRNERAKFVEAFWSIIDWGEVSRRFESNS